MDAINAIKHTTSDEPSSLMPPPCFTTVNVPLDYNYTQMKTEPKYPKSLKKHRKRNILTKSTILQDFTEIPTEPSIDIINQLKENNQREDANLVPKVEALRKLFDTQNILMRQQICNAINPNDHKYLKLTLPM